MKILHEGRLKSIKGKNWVLRTENPNFSGGSNETPSLESLLLESIMF